LRENRKNILGADKATIKKGEARQRHEKHERRSSHHPGVISGARSRNIRSCWRVYRIGAARRIIYIGFEIGHALLQRWRRGR
jgi:hypothetical protein